MLLWEQLKCDMYSQYSYVDIFIVIIIILNAAATGVIPQLSTLTHIHDFPISR